MNSDQSKNEVNLKTIPILIDRAVRDWENKMRETDKYFDGFEELGSLINLHPGTIRKYCNKHNPIYPTIDHLLQICVITGCEKPLTFISEYYKQIKTISN